MSTDKTLADVQPGGRVRLGDALKALDDLAAFCSDDTATVDRHVAVIRAALSAQPSPGGQDAHEMADALERIAAGSLSDYEGVDADELHILRCAKLIRDLAARQPVGEPVAWMDPDGSRVLTAKAKANASGAYKSATSGYTVPLFRSPAQAVDLEQFRDAITREYANSRALCDMPRILECERLLALIDSMAVGNG